MAERKTTKKAPAKRRSKKAIQDSPVTRPQTTGEGAGVEFAAPAAPELSDVAEPEGGREATGGGGEAVAGSAPPPSKSLEQIVRETHPGFEPRTFEPAPVFNEWQHGIGPEFLERVPEQYRRQYAEAAERFNARLKESLDEGAGPTFTPPDIPPAPAGKPAYKSLTILGIVVAFVAGILPDLTVLVGALPPSNFTRGALTAFGVAGAVVAVYGRMTASEQLKGPFKAEHKPTPLLGGNKLENLELRLTNLEGVVDAMRGRR